MIKISEPIENNAASNINWCIRNFNIHEYRFYVKDGLFVYVFENEDHANFFLLSRNVTVKNIEKEEKSNSNCNLNDRLWC